MKSIIGLLIVICTWHISYGQTKIEKIVPVKEGQNINFDFTWPELITFKTWTGTEVKLVATVEINKGQNDNAFKFKVDQSSSETHIASFIENFKSLPRKIVIRKGGQEYFFNTDDTNSPEIRKFKEENGEGGYDYINHGVIMDITLEVWVPNNISIDVYSKYGMIEVLGFTGNMKVHSKFGGIDVSTTGNQPIKAGTKFGEKYTNLEYPIRSISVGNHPGKWDWVQLGATKSSKKHELKSDFGNIYIRKM
jgi:hypothetical protein